MYDLNVLLQSTIPIPSHTIYHISYIPAQISALLFSDETYVYSASLRDSYIVVPDAYVPPIQTTKITEMRGKWAKPGKKWGSSISTTLRMRDFLTIAAASKRQEKISKSCQRPKKCRMRRVMKRLIIEGAACSEVRQLIHRPQYYCR